MGRVLIFPKETFFRTIAMLPNDRWPVYDEEGRVTLRYHRALAQQTTVNTYKQETLEGIVRADLLSHMLTESPAYDGHFHLEP